MVYMNNINAKLSNEEKLKLAHDWIYESYDKNIVFFGGAGVSTESGIPDFRSKDGLYNQHDVQFEEYEPEYLLSRSCLKFHPDVFFEFYRQKLDTRDIKPNLAHYALAELEAQRKGSKGSVKIITQNIDGLHQKAGSETVYEIHGTTQKVYCSKCKKIYPVDYIFTTTGIPKCQCGGLIRPDVTLYEEELPEKAWNLAHQAVKKADILIVAGTSLRVYPAASLLTHFSGDHLIVINLEPLNIQLSENDMQINMKCGEALSKIVNMRGKN